MKGTLDDHTDFWKEAQLGLEIKNPMRTHYIGISFDSRDTEASNRRDAMLGELRYNQRKVNRVINVATKVIACLAFLILSSIGLYYGWYNEYMDEDTLAWLNLDMCMFAFMIWIVIDVSPYRNKRLKKYNKKKYESIGKREWNNRA